MDSSIKRMKSLASYFQAFYKESVCVCVCSLIGSQQSVFYSFMMTDKRVHLIYGEELMLRCIDVICCLCFLSSNLP